MRKSPWTNYIFKVDALGKDIIILLTWARFLLQYNYLYDIQGSKKQNK